MRILSQAHAAAKSAQWEAAARLYQQVITQQPDQLEALESLGITLLRLAQPAEAARCLDKARRAAPRDARLLGLLARAQRQSGAIAEAIDTYQRALALDAQHPELWMELGIAQLDAKELQAAAASFSRAIQLKPDAARIWHLLAQTLCAAGKLTEGLQVERQALGRNPWLSEAHLGEGELLERVGSRSEAMISYFVASLLPEARGVADARLTRLSEQPVDPNLEAPVTQAAQLRELLSAREDAERVLALGRQLCAQQRDAGAVLCFEHVLGMRPSREVCSELAQALWRIGLHERAQQRLVDALDLDPDDVPTYRLLGGWLASELNFVGDEARWQRLVAGCPADVVALVNLGAAAQRMGRPSDAVALQQRALELRPDLIEPYINLGAALCDQGSLVQANAAHRQALKIDPTRWAVHSNLLLNAHFDPSATPEDLLAQHRGFGKALSEWVGPVSASVERNPDPHRPLRIGYVSPDFNEHPVGYFLEPVLREHDRSAFEIFCYSDVGRPDATTARLRQLATVYRACAGDDDAALYERIRADRIDILVDLAGHGLNNRLPVFARKPSPLSVSYLGYFDTTGLSSIDYRIADIHSVPSGAERYFTEQVVRLLRSSTCFLPRQSPEVAAPPCLRRGYVTFGCFSNPAKITRDAAATFGRILRGLPQSRLLLKYHTFADPGVQARFLRWFAEEAIGRERILFQGHGPLEQYLATFGEIDIGLDPFPYSGETTALHTLWMGVPLVALEGKTVAQRLASRVLRVAQLDDWVARGPDEYVRIAQRLAGDPAALQAVRSSLRELLRRSALLDHRGVTRELEAAYRGMWQRWCASVTPVEVHAAAALAAP